MTETSRGRERESARTGIALSEGGQGRFASLSEVGGTGEEDDGLEREVDDDEEGGEAAGKTAPGDEPLCFLITHYRRRREAKRRTKTSKMAERPSMPVKARKLSLPNSPLLAPTSLT